MDNKVLCIGEALIDFVPTDVGIDLKNVEGFIKKPGGAPANVAATVSILGGKSALITQLGEDAFGDFLVDTLEDAHVDTKYVFRTKEANTALAFVSLKENGDRDFSFYRNPSADMLLSKDKITSDMLNSNDIIHFCSVDLIESPMKETHVKLLEEANKKDLIVSFDPNVRLPLWPDEKSCQETINEFIPYASIV